MCGVGGWAGGHGDDGGERRSVRWHALGKRALEGENGRHPGVAQACTSPHSESSMHEYAPMRRPVGPVALQAHSKVAVCAAGSRWLCATGAVSHSRGAPWRRVHMARARNVVRVGGGRVRTARAPGRGRAEGRHGDERRRPARDCQRHHGPAHTHLRARDTRACQCCRTPACVLPPPGLPWAPHHACTLLVCTLSRLVSSPPSLNVARMFVGTHEPFPVTNSSLDRIVDPSEARSAPC